MFYTIDKMDHGLPHDPFKAIVAPRPIGWITSMSANGDINLAPYSFFNGITDKPPIVMFSSEGPKDSVAFVEETKEFVCSLATFDLRDQMNGTAAPLPRGISVVGVHIDDRYIKDGRLDTAAMRPIARLGYNEYAVVDSVFKMTRPPGGG